MELVVVQFGKQDKVHELMPWYCNLIPTKPIVMAGAPSHLGLWVKGASDFGPVTDVKTYPCREPGCTAVFTKAVARSGHESGHAAKKAKSSKAKAKA